MVPLCSRIYFNDDDHVAQSFDFSKNSKFVSVWLEIKPEPGGFKTQARSKIIEKYDRDIKQVGNSFEQHDSESLGGKCFNFESFSCTLFSLVARYICLGWINILNVI